jgi:sec-independent protein translocase protein TatB
MFDISWTEFLLIGVVALVVIGPKELPAVMRTMGQWTRKVRGMASDFQNQFQEAMREAEMADLKKQVDDMARDVKDMNPLKGVRDDIENVGKDVEHSLSSAPEQTALPAAGSEPALTETAAEPAPAPAEAPAVPAVEVSSLPPPETTEKAEQANGTGSPG